MQTAFFHCYQLLMGAFDPALWSELVGIFSKQLRVPADDVRRDPDPGSGGKELPANASAPLRDVARQRDRRGRVDAKCLRDAGRELRHCLVVRLLVLWDSGQGS